jgi:hypothetical protein
MYSMTKKNNDLTATPAIDLHDVLFRHGTDNDVNTGNFCESTCYRPCPAVQLLGTEVMPVTWIELAACVADRQGLSFMFMCV